MEESIKIVRKFNLNNRFRDCGIINNAIDRVLNELERLQKDNYKLDRENQLLFEENILLKAQNITYEVDNKEVSDALHMLLHCSLKDTEYVTQVGQFNIVSKYIKQLETENSNISRELLHRTDELNKLLEENELANNTINELLQKAGCIDNDNTVVCKSFQCALYGAEAYVKMKNKEYIEQINKLQKAKEELVVLFEGRLKSIVETSYIPKQVIRDKIEELENAEHEKLSEKYYFDYQCNLYDFIAGVKKGLKELLGDE